MHVAEIGGVRTRYWVGGEGPPLLLVHGLGGAPGNFAAHAPLHAPRHPVLLTDQPGHGGSPSVDHPGGRMSVGVGRDRQPAC